MLALAEDDKFIEKLGLVEDKIYFLLNDGTFGIQDIDFDKNDDDGDGGNIALLSDLWSHRFEPPRRCAPPLLSQGGEILQLD